MTKEDMDLAVKEIHKYLIDKGALYWQAKWVLRILNQEYEKKGCQLLDLMEIKELAEVKKERGKERLF
ncbi:hypothetical protein [uncultured Selenomonas sp.]|uniref:hypothetical protein n=1 Tax=uncultured Selenomonas sp. TaxID=159275 RepID=UPI0028E5C409|nr:hypothetical protein [uncultured Selenomonas sp.]